MGHCPARPPLPPPHRVPAAENCPHSHLWQSCRVNNGNAGQCVNHLLPTCPLVYLANQNHNTAELNLPCHSNSTAIAYSAIPHPIVHFQTYQLPTLPEAGALLLLHTSSPAYSPCSAFAQLNSGGCFSLQSLTGCQLHCSQVSVLLPPGANLLIC